MKRFSRLLTVALFTLLLLAAAPHSQAATPPEAPDLILEVDGLACPFCAYGLEKKLKNVDGVQSLKVKIDAGEVEIMFEEDRTVEEEQIREAVADAGFTVRKITYPNGQPGRSTASGGA